ncbi:MAG: CHAT domain-containing protein [Symploca sp. SIO1A3]|nr:CHAT domain-containing protein [Symploca sp. SIO1A3]
MRNSRFPILFFLSLICCLWLGHPASIAQPGNSANANQLVEQGVDYFQAGDYQAAIKPWENALEFYQDTSNYQYSATVQENLARAYQKIGDIKEEIRYWKQAISDYKQLSNWQQMGLIQTELAQAYSRFGQSRKAIALVCGPSDAQEAVTCTGGSLEIAKQFADQEGEMAALGSLGEAYRLQGKYEQAIARLQESLKIAQELNNSAAQTATLNNLGNAYKAQAQLTESYVNSAQQRKAKVKEQEYLKESLKCYNQAQNYLQTTVQLASSQNNQFAQMRALMDLVKLYHPLEEVRQRVTDNSDEKTSTTGEISSICSSEFPTPPVSLDIEATIQQALDLLKQLPDSQDKVYAAINLATLKQPTPFADSSLPNPCGKLQLARKAENLLNKAASIAKRLENYRAQSFALGELGHIYECRQDYQQALKFTQQAQWAANQDLSAKDSLYLWEWQAGRIFRAQDMEEETTNSYKQAIATLKDIRNELLIAERDQQFDFRDAINPLHREFAKFILNQAQDSADSQDKSEKLESALETIDSLKLAELQNYYGDDCVLITFSPEKVEELVGDHTAVFSSIILSDRTAILVSLPKGKKRLEEIEIDSQKLRNEINQFREGLEDRGVHRYNLKPAQELYQKIIAPFADDLKSAGIETLVFIQDGILRSIPMAALHDGEKFLVESYAIATTPSLKLTNPQTLNRDQLRVLALGLSEASEVNGQKFSALDNVEDELKEVKAIFPGSKSKELLNEKFTQKSFKDELEQTPYPMLHIATHGQFRAIQEETFLVTGNNGKLTLEDLENTISSVSSQPNSGELLALTACQTAKGDDRAALGLAGIAVRAGVSSALASLWSINDASTPLLVKEFYDNLSRPGVSKAQALQAAQRKLIEAKKEKEIKNKYAHPYYWAPFILIGNWL